jgi:hypothetical protein
MDTFCALCNKKMYNLPAQFVGDKNIVHGECLKADDDNRKSFINSPQKEPIK